MRTSTSNPATQRLVAMILILCCKPAAADELASISSTANPAAASSAWSLAAAKYAVEAYDLYALAFQESRRRRPDGMYRPWPWTLNSPATGPLYFETYEAALDKLTSLIASGETNIDVGLMGVNWRHNGHRAADPGTLLLPVINIPIAAQIYREKLDRFGGDRRQAMAHYHNARPERGLPYAASALATAEFLRKSALVQLALAE